ncbi:hypothetical protein IH981_03635 [Patescibacteria group bacterium]|nr:hypothetical protein [Patescibacteria group bacterium]
MPTELPDSGGEPPSGVGSPRAEFVILGIIGMAAPVGFLIWRRLHSGFF